MEMIRDVVIFALGLLFGLGLSWSRDREGHLTAPYTGQLISQLIETVDRAFRRTRLP